ncbi:PfkB protein [Chondrocystis sp. NIES-4102]|nr:PfkB protein [Chondrocystis sp. NIES-4102]
MNTKAIAERTPRVIAQNPARVICLGEILLDCLADELGKSVLEVKSWTPYPGGAPANVACALAKLGTPSAFIGCVGKDAEGQELVQLLQTIGVNTSGIQYSDQFPTRQIYVTRTDNGDRSFAGFGDRSPDQFADAYLQAKYLPPELFLEAEFLVLGTLELAYPQAREAVFRALDLAETYHLKIILDINWRPMFWLNESEALPLIQKLLHYVDFLKLSAQEAKWLFNTADAGVISHRIGSVEGVLVTDGDAQVSYCLSDNEGTIKPIQIVSKDTTGAGDAFLAGFIHKLARETTRKLNDPQIAANIVSYACAVGGLTTTKSGAIAAQPTDQEVAEFMAGHKV